MVNQFFYERPILGRFFFLALLTLISSCSSIQKKTCNLKYAKSRAKFDAANWSRPHSLEHEKEICKDYSDYNGKKLKRDYKKNYMAELSAQCSTKQVVSKGSEDGAKLRFGYKTYKSLGLCKKVSKNYKFLKNTYKKAFYQSKCKVATAQAHGKQHVKETRAISPSLFSSCPTRITMAYVKEFKSERDQFCSMDSVKAMAQEMARADKEVVEGVSKLSICNKKKRSALIPMFLETFANSKGESDFEMDSDELREMLKVVESKHYFKTLNGSYYSLCKFKKNKALVSIVKIKGTQSRLSGEFKVTVKNERDIILDERSEFVTGSFLTNEKIKQEVWFYSINSSEDLSCKAKFNANLIRR